MEKRDRLEIMGKEKRIEIQFFPLKEDVMGIVSSLEMQKQNNKKRKTHFGIVEKIWKFSPSFALVNLEKLHLSSTSGLVQKAEHTQLNFIYFLKKKNSF